MVDHAARRARLAVALAAAGLDALLVTSLVNVRYLTGFTGSNAALLVPSDAADDPLLCTDGRYVTQVESQAPDLPLLVARSCAVALAEQAAGRGLATVGFEDHDLSVAGHAEVARAAQGVRLVGAGRAVEELRVVKDDGELALLAEACEISCAALDALLVAPPWTGRTERDLAGELELTMRRLGAEAPAFPTIVGSGPNSAVPHHTPTERALARGDLVVLDFGARVGGYHADITRTVVLGPPADWQVDLAELVAASQRSARAALRAGTGTGAVDAAARQVIEAAGRGAAFGHGTGHGVGLEIHEAPNLGPARPVDSGRQLR